MFVGLLPINEPVVFSQIYVYFCFTVALACYHDPRQIRSLKLLYKVFVIVKDLTLFANMMSVHFSSKTFKTFMLVHSYNKL